MRIGVNLLNFGPGASPDSLAGWTQLAETLGYHLVMISDHVAMTPDVVARYPAPYYDPFVTLGWLARATKRVDFGTSNSFALNAELEFQRNVERYAFLRWGQTSFQNFKAVPPGTGICHQVNLEYLARVVCAVPSGNRAEAYPDSLVGTDSHTTMVN